MKGDMSNLLKQAQQMQARMEQMQRKLAEMTVVGESGGGLVKFEMTCLSEGKKVHIDPSLYEEEDKEILCDLLVAAFNDAIRKAKDASRNEMGGITAGFNLPGMI